MIGRALNINNDIIYESGKFKTVENAAETVQYIRSKLLLYKGEWFLNINAGIPYFQEIFTRPVNLANIESIFKSTILNTPNINKLVEFSMDYKKSPNRKLTITFSAETTYGLINNQEVTINA